jgi:hypothetical protein
MHGAATGDQKDWAGGSRNETSAATSMPADGPSEREELHPHYARSHSLLQLGPFNYDQGFWSHTLAKKNISLFPLDGRRVDNFISQFSPPSRFGTLYRPQLSQSSNVKVMLFAKVTEIQTDDSATTVTGVRMATLNGRHRERALLLLSKANFLSHFIWDTYEAILDACCDAWNALMAKSGVIASIGTRDWAQVKI